MSNQRTETRNPPHPRESGEKENAMSNAPTVRTLTHPDSHNEDSMIDPDAALFPAANALPTRPQDLARLANAEHSAASDHARSALTHAVEAGRLLADAKAALSHGDFGPWLAENITFSDRTARGYMRLHRERDRLRELVDAGPPANRQSIADLGVADALALLAAPPSDSARGHWTPRDGHDYSAFILSDGPPANYARVASAGAGRFWCAVTFVRVGAVYGEWKSVVIEDLRPLLASHNVDADAVQWREQAADPAHAGRDYSPLMFEDDEEGRQKEEQCHRHHLPAAERKALEARDAAALNLSDEGKAYLKGEWQAGKELVGAVLRERDAEGE